MGNRKPTPRRKGRRKTGGRQKGTPNKVSKSAREFSQLFLADAQGQAKLLALFRAGKLPPNYLVLLHHYAYGKPKDTVEVTGKDGKAVEHEHKMKLVLQEAEQYGDVLVGIRNRHLAKAVPPNGSGKPVDGAAPNRPGNGQDKRVPG